MISIRGDVSRRPSETSLSQCNRSRYQRRWLPPDPAHFEEHSDSVIDRIFAEIKEYGSSSPDFTGRRRRSLLEAGFARGLRLDVIWTCRKDEMEKLHFDVRGFNVIDWKEPTDFAKG